MNNYIEIYNPINTELKIFNTSYGDINMRCIAGIRLATAYENNELIKTLDNWEILQKIIFGTYKTIKYKSLDVYVDGKYYDTFEDYKVYIGFVDDNLNSKNPLMWNSRIYNYRIYNKKIFQSFIVNNKKVMGK